MKCLEYKGYIGSIEVDFEENFLHGKLLHIRDLVTYEGSSPEELRQAFEESVDFYLEDCAETGVEPDKPFKGSFNIRVSPELHKELAMCARSLNRSLNDYVGFILRNHHSFDTHRKAAQAASEAAWFAMSGFSRVSSRTEIDARLLTKTHGTHTQEKSVGTEKENPSVLEFKPVLHGSERIQ